MTRPAWSALRQRLGLLARDVLATLRGADVSFVAAGLTFYAAIAVIPLMLSALYLAGLIVGEDTVVSLGAGIVAYAPEQLGLRRGLDALRGVGPGLGAASFIAAMIPATSYGEGLLRAFGRFTAGSPTKSTSLRGRLLTSMLLALFPLVTLAGLFSVAGVEQVLGAGLGARVLGVYLAFLFGWVSTSLVVMTIYHVFGFGRFGVAGARGRSAVRPPLLWGSAATGSFLAGMTLGWLAVLEIGIDVGAAYGGSRDLGSAVLFVVYLYLVQFVLLVGYVLTGHLNGQVSASSSSAGRRRHPDIHHPSSRSRAQ